MIKKILSASAILAFAATTAAGATGSGSTTIAANLSLQGVCSITPPSSGFNFGTLLPATATQTPTSNDVALPYTCTGGTVPNFNLYDTNITGANAPNYTLTGTSVSSGATLLLKIAAGTGSPLTSFSGGAQLSDLSTGASGLTLTAETGTIQLIAQATVPTSTVADNYSDLLTATVSF